MVDQNKDISERNKGKITCDRKILLSIINLAAREISGLSRLVSPLKNRFLNFFFRNVQGGVRVQFKESNTIIVDVYMRVLYGHKVPEIAFRIQENVKNAIAAMVDMNTAKVNIHVMGVDFEHEEAYVTV